MGPAIWLVHGAGARGSRTADWAEARPLSTSLGQEWSSGRGAGLRDTLGPAQAAPTWEAPVEVAPGPGKALGSAGNLY